MGTSPAPPVPPRGAAVQAAINAGFHKLTKSAFHDKLWERILQQPAVPLAALRPNQDTCYFYGERNQRNFLFQVTRATPAGRKVSGHYYPSLEPGTLTTTGYGIKRSFREIDLQLADWITVAHEALVMIMVTGHRQPEEIPAEVRREYPNLFIPIPAHFGDNIGKAPHDPKNATERVRSALLGHRLWTPTADTYREAISAQTAIIERYRSERALAVVRTPAVAGDYDKLIDNALADIEFFRWLIPHVAEGGVFYIPVPEAERASGEPPVWATAQPVRTTALLNR